MMYVSQSDDAQLLKTGPGAFSCSQLCLKSLSQLSCYSRDNTDSESFSSPLKAVKALTALKFWSSVLFSNFYNPWKWGDALCEGKLGEFLCLLPNLARVVCIVEAEGLTPSAQQKNSLALAHKNNKLNLPTLWPVQLCCNGKQSNSACCNFIIMKEKETSLATRYLLQK